jgi:hypothetical protein
LVIGFEIEAGTMPGVFEPGTRTRSGQMQRNRAIASFPVSGGGTS